MPAVTADWRAVAADLAGNAEAYAALTPSERALVRHRVLSTRPSRIERGILRLWFRLTERAIRRGTR